MTYSRIDALAYLQGEFGSLAEDVGLDQDDSPNGYEGVLNRAFRAAGVEQADLAAALVEDEAIADTEALLDYYALHRLKREYSKRVAVSKGQAGGASVSRAAQQAFAQIKELLAEAIPAAQETGLLPVTGVEAGYINLDFLEPASVEDSR